MNSQHILTELRKRDATLAALLQDQRNSLKPALRRLEETINADALMAEIREEEGKTNWQDTGQFYMSSNRWHEAIEVFRRLYEKICGAPESKDAWLAKGMPLVWISECHRNLGNNQLSARYLILTAVSDAIRDQGKVNADAGVYFRARWRSGWTDEELEQFYSECFTNYDQKDGLSVYPEFTLSKVRVPFGMPYASPGELDRYEINQGYASGLLQRMETKGAAGTVDGKDLERLAGYLLGWIPGFEVRKPVLSEAGQYDGIIRNTGPKHDFREDLGFHLLVECKDWKKAVGVGEVSNFINKLFLQDCRAGILFSSSGITGEGERKNAELQLLKAHYRAGKVVMVLSKSDFQKAASGANLITSLREKYEEVRFDIPQ